MSTKQKHEATYVGLDIGSSKVVCVVGLAQAESATPSIIGLGVAPLSGVRRGVVNDVEETVSAITAALEEAERMSGVAIERATINVDGVQVQCMNSKGVVAVARADHEIALEDLARAEEAASAITLNANRQLLSVIPRSYSVDDQTNVVDPVGMNGIKLEVDTHILTVSIPAMKNLHNSVFRSGIAINSQLPTPLAAAKAILKLSEKEAGVALVHIGAETTGIAIYQDGMISYTSILPIGSNNITKDLVYGLRTTPEVAEKIKLDHAIAGRPMGKTNKKINLEDYGSAGNVYQYDIDTIVHSRLEEILTLAKEEVIKVVKDPKVLGAGIVFSGGGANITELGRYATEVFKVPSTVAKVSHISGVAEHISDPTYASAIGLMLEDMQQPKNTKRIGHSNVLHTISAKAVSIIKGLLP
ncbi:MAG: cell division protein FtsA [Candidatus Saccharibacteria bacterium]